MRLADGAYHCGVEISPAIRYSPAMIITLPDMPATLGMSEAEIRLELACSLFARGKVSSQVAAEIAGTGYGAFLDALRERRISGYTSTMLREDIESLNRLFPDPLPLPAA